ncbi:MAG: 6-carboxytetrahydropterin synthase [Planctomycetes bacterium]|nr:6-carboxytetrahydropterin synthase [Planctomycetota bacterium]
MGIAPYLVLRVTVSGVPEPATGYLINIVELDKLLRNQAIPLTATLLSRVGVKLTGEQLVRGIWEGVVHGVPERCELEKLQLWTTPFLSYAVMSKEPGMVELTQCFEFSASHRLHVPSMSDAENKTCFGKCNNPNGHGHNYQVEVTIGRQTMGDDGTVLLPPEFEEVVRREVIDRLDHKHLNADVREFQSVNPSVENIAKTIWGYLHGKLGAAQIKEFASGRRRRRTLNTASRRTFECVNRLDNGRVFAGRWSYFTSAGSVSALSRPTSSPIASEDGESLVTSVSTASLTVSTAATTPDSTMGSGSGPNASSEMTDILAFA